MDRFQSIDEILAALRRRAFVILVITLTGSILSVFLALQQTKTFEATAVLQIEDARVPEELAGAAAETNQSSRRVRLIEQRLMARDNLLDIMEKYDLFQDGAMPTGQRLALMRQSASIVEINNPSGGFGRETPSGLYITVRLGDPQKAADVANELMYSVIEQSRERSVGRARDTLDFFEAEESRVRGEIEALEAELAAFKRENAAQLPDGLIELRSQLGDLRAGELDLDAQIVALQTTQERQREDVQARNLALLREQRALLEARIAELEQLLAGAPDVERRLNALERELEQLQAEFTVIARRKAEAELGQVLEDREQTDRIEVLETALVPDYPVSRSRRSVAITGALLSLVAGFAFAAAVELLNPAIRNTAQMERALGVSPVVAVPHIQTAAGRRQEQRMRVGWVALVAALIAMAAVVSTTSGLGDTLAGWLAGG